MSDLEQERDFYRQHCNELGKRLLRLQEEQTRARREARRSRTTARLVRDIYRMADADISIYEINIYFLQIVLDTLSVDRAALLAYLPEQEQFIIQNTLGFSQTPSSNLTPPDLPAEFYFVNSKSQPNPMIEWLQELAGGPFLLWAFDPGARLAFLVSNDLEDQHLHRPFEANDQEIIEGALSVLIDVIERKRAEALIRNSLQEKEILLQEIHHRVKNNLQIISSLLNLQAGYVEDPRVLASFQDSQNRIRSMALIHEKLYRSENLAQVDLADYIQDLVAFLSRSYQAQAHHIELDIETEKLFLEIDKAVLCGLILNELISNSLKHAFPEGRTGKIWVTLQTTGSRQIRMSVGDNGVGFPAAFDFRSTSTLGLQLVKTLVGQLKGRLEMERTPISLVSITLGIPGEEEKER